MRLSATVRPVVPLHKRLSKLVRQKAKQRRCSAAQAASKFGQKECWRSNACRRIGGFKNDYDWALTEP